MCLCILGVYDGVSVSVSFSREKGERGWMMPMRHARFPQLNNTVNLSCVKKLRKCSIHGTCRRCFVGNHVSAVKLSTCVVMSVA